MNEFGYNSPTSLISNLFIFRINSIFRSFYLLFNQIIHFLTRHRWFVFCLGELNGRNDIIEKIVTSQSEPTCLLFFIFKEFRFKNWTAADRLLCNNFYAIQTFNIDLLDIFKFQRTQSPIPYVFNSICCPFAFIFF